MESYAAKAESIKLALPLANTERLAEYEEKRNSE